MSKHQSSFWPDGFAAQFFPGRHKWAVIGAYEALEPSNILAAIEQTKGTMAADVIAALIFDVDCYQITLRAQEAEIQRLTSNASVSGRGAAAPEDTNDGCNASA